MLDGSFHALVSNILVLAVVFALRSDGSSLELLFGLESVFGKLLCHQCNLLMLSCHLLSLCTSYGTLTVVWKSHIGCQPSL